MILRRDGAPVARGALQKMAQSAAHRGPDAEGIVELGAVGLAHRRLAVIDTDHRSDQPMRRGDSWLVFNGAIYNFPELRRELEALGDRFETSGDTEVLLHVLDRWWIEGLDRLNGMFSLCFYDSDRRRMLLARDRFGIKPLVWCQDGQQIAAATEAKQLIASGCVEAHPDMRVAQTFLEHGMLSIGTDSFFRDIKTVEPGHAITIELASGTVEDHRWYDLADRAAPISIDLPAAAEKLRALLADSVRIRHIADVRVGGALSGGLDSSSLCALSAHYAGADFQTFTTFHPNSSHDERHHARLVGTKFGLSMVEVPVDMAGYYTPDWLKKAGYIHDQPIPSGSHFNEHALFDAARASGVTVMIDGQGSDEILGGYGEYWLMAQRLALRSGRLDHVWQGLEGRRAGTGDSRRLALAKMLVAIKNSGDYGVSPLLQGAVKIRLPDPRQPGADFRTLSLDEVRRTSLPYQLHSQDRSAMNASIESRLPFLDYRVVEFGLSLPTSLKVGGGWQKRVLREAMHDLPPAIRWRRDKVGFTAPDAEYTAANFSKFRTMIAEAAYHFRDFLDPVRVLANFDRHADASTPYDPAIFRMLSLAGWWNAFSVSL